MKNNIIFSLLFSLLFASCDNDKDIKNDIVNYEISEANSHIEWRGYLRDANNFGTFSLNNDDIITENGKVTGGSFTVHVSSVNVLNLQGDLKEQLEHHLLSADFFNAAVYPQVTFTIKKVTPYTDIKEEGVINGANYTLTGELKMIGSTKDITFPARILVNNDQVDAEALIRIDRLNWGMNYASDPNAGQYILPDVDLHLKLLAKKK